MSISSTLSNAMSGLSAAARSVENVSTNLANASVDGYGRRELELSSGQFGGVQVSAVQREVDQLVIEDRRKLDAHSAFQYEKSNFYTSLETAIGQPQDLGSLTQRVADFDVALIEAESRPDIQNRLDAVVNAAENLTHQINDISNAIQAERTKADQGIGKSVDLLTSSLNKIRDLNHDIRTGQPSDASTLALMDQRQQVLDEISHMVPMKTYARGDGEIAIYTETGTALLDGRVSEITFTASNAATPYQTSGSGLSNLTIDGNVVNFSDQKNPMANGSIAAQFAIRDEYGVKAQTQIDSFAANLVNRFQSPSVDPSLGPTDAGLFTDNQAQYNPANELALSQRLELNFAVVSSQGGTSLKVRNGLNAASGAPMDSSIITNLGVTLRSSDMPSSTSLGHTALSLSDFTNVFLSDASSLKEGALFEYQFAAQQREAFKAQELAGGVDTDQEMQKLLLIETAYAANARVIQAADDMLQSLLRI